MDSPVNDLNAIRATSAYKALETTLALQSTPVVAVVGAGLSQPAGLPAWGVLRERLCDGLRDQVIGAEPEKAKRIRLDAERWSSEKDFWVSFEALRRLLGLAEYRAILRDALAIGDTATIPGSYRTLWSLPIRGILSLNLDSLARRAHSAVHPGAELKNIVGRDAARLARLVHSPHRFLYQLHGSADDVASWIFTSSDLKKLYNTPGYSEFLDLVFSTCTVVFLGVTADDLAIGSPLLNLTGRDADGLTHYWITDRQDTAAEIWAAACGVRIVRYPASQHGLVMELLTSLGGARAPEIEANPVLIPSANPPTTLPAPSALLALPLDELRALLNGHARYLLDQTDGVSRFEEFLDVYDEVINRAWFIPRKPEGAMIFGHTLQRSELGGAFGRVFPATDPQGELCALKLLRGEIRTNLPLLQSYRRGVKAMEILSVRNVAGMVAYRQASEIPAFVTMDWIDGPNLAEAKAARLLQEWEHILWVVVELCRVIRRAHSLPERVLHRDIRPANVMLRNGWLPREDWEVLVLDFDLSTYHGAEEKSVLAERSILGYLAPEQVDPTSKFSSRSGLVDSFGIGMTLYFLCGGTEPRANFERSSDFLPEVRTATRAPDDCEWRSMARRIERLILSATNEAQNRRPDVSQILHECTRLQTCLLSPLDAIDTDLICEELVARTPSMVRYEWDSDADSARRESAGGIVVQMQGGIEGDQIDLYISWSARGTERYAALRSISARVSRAESLLKKNGWRITTATKGPADLTISAHSPARTALTQMDHLADGLEQAIQAVTIQ